MIQFSNRSIRFGTILTLAWMITAMLIPPALVSSAPQASSLSIHITSQRFAHGTMVYRSDTGAIWLLASSGQAYQFPSTTYGSLPDNPISSGFRLLRPINGFGKVWGNHAWVRNTLGWPVLPEFGHTSQIVTNGTSLYLTRFNDQIIQIDRGTWRYVSNLPPVTPPPTPVVHHFTADQNTVNPGGTVVLNWHITGTDFALIEAYDSAGQLIGLLEYLTLTDSAPIVVPMYEQQHIRLVLWGANYPDFPNPVNMVERVLSAEITITIQAQGPHTAYTRAAFQQYANGFMIWRADNGTILVFSGAQGGPVYTFPLSAYGYLPNNPFYAPIGFITPINGFGKVWGNHDWVRDSLSWATQPEAAYDMTIETHAPNSTQSYLLPSGQIAEITGGYTWHLR